ncbi:MAG: DNA polymerase I [Catenisphaera adipataccumulans]|uniref:DNA polymerase I n=1 Tax=Catenisphaera adipataccumulans TaxID=700500 RepID=UPI003D9358F3
MNHLLLLDGNSMLFRAYYATLYSHRMSTSNGIPTNAVYGFVMMLNKAIDLLHPDAILVAWDADSQTFRKQEYEPYKGTRKPLDDELKVQFPIVREYLDAAGMKRYEIHGYEADDIIGTMAKQTADIQTTILTSDRDLLQLIDASTNVLLMKKGLSEMQLMDEAAFRETYGLEPVQIIDMKGLMGDASDNIPGVAGVGEKTAIRLLKQYPSVEEVYAHLDGIKGKLKEKLEKDKDNAFLSKHLATIYRDVDLPFTVEDCGYEANDDELNAFFSKYEMRSLMKAQKQEPAVTYEFKTVHVWDVHSEWILPVCTPEPYLKQQCFGFIGLEDHTVYYIKTEDAQNDPAFRHALTEGFSTWNQKECMHLLNRYGLPEGTYHHDLHLAAFLLHSQATSVDALLEAMHIQTPETFHDLAKKSKTDPEQRLINFYRALIEQIARKADKIFEECRKEELWDLYTKIEKPLSSVLYEMETQGIHIDEQILDEIGDEIHKHMEESAAMIYERAGKEFNINSPKQLAGVLYDDMKLKHPGRKRSTSADVLKKMQDQDPIIPALLEYRKYAKIQSTYIDGLKKHIQPDAKIHTTFHQTMTQTGRLSSSEPNLQNISIRDEQGKEIRKAFTAPEGYVLLSADYSQIELRMLAHMADETHMIEAFNNDEDIHNRTATLIFDCDKEDVTPNMRRTAKTVNFGIVYGQTEFGLAEQLGISRLEAREFMNSYFSKYTQIHQYMNSLVDFCKEHGYVQTLFKRRRYIPEINDKNYMTREFGKRAAMNAPIQGSAADLIKIAMIQVDRAMKEADLQSKMLLQIHDELIFLIPQEELETMKKLVKDTMEHAMKLKVPLKAEIAYGQSWYEAK